MGKSIGLTVRHHDRWSVELPIQFVVADAHRSQVCFSSTSLAEDQFSVRGTSIDLSLGGVGFRCRQYLPRNCRGSLRILKPEPVAARSRGSSVMEIALEHAVVVRRVTMSGREPMYLIGTSFVDPLPDLERRIVELTHSMQQSATLSGERAANA